MPETLIDHYAPTTEADRAAAWALRELPGGAETATWEIARGRIVARYREGIRDRPMRIAIVARPEGDAGLVTDGSGSELWRAYLAPTLDEAHRAARWILASGAAYNW